MDASAPKILDRLVTSPVSELQFVRLPAEGKGQQLMAETDSEKRRAAHEVFRRLHRGRENLGMGRIPGTVGQDDSIRLVRQDFVRGRVVRYANHVCIPLGLADDVSLHAAIDHDEGPFSGTGIPFDPPTTHLADEVPRVGVRRLADLADDGVDVLFGGADRGLHRPFRSNLDRESADARPLNRWSLIGPQEFGNAARTPRMARSAAPLRYAQSRSLDRP